MDPTEMSEESDFEDLFESVPDIIANSAPAPLPERTMKKYEITYNKFKDWCAKKNINHVSEKVLLAYFLKKSEQLKSSSLYAIYSMLKASLAVKENIDIKRFTKLNSFLSEKSIGYCAKKAKIFTRDQVNKFLIEAPDDKYLMMKVVLILAIAGGCTRHELVSLTVDDIEVTGSVLIVNITGENIKKRSFTIIGRKEGLNVVDIYRKYASLRPLHTPHRRFFLGYHHGKCSSQVAGVNTLGKAPSEIAKFLRLENPSYYNSQSFRKSATALAAEVATDVLSFTRRQTNKLEHENNTNLAETNNQPKDSLNHSLGKEQGGEAITSNSFSETEALPHVKSEILSAYSSQEFKLVVGEDQEGAELALGSSPERVSDGLKAIKAEVYRQQLLMLKKEEEYKEKHRLREELAFESERMRRAKKWELEQKALLLDIKIKEAQLRKVHVNFVDIS